MVETKLLEEIGLTKTEIKIYLMLLKYGESTTTHIVREAKIHASKVYEFLDKLIQKGLVTYTIKANKKHFTAEHPDYIQEFIKEKERKIKDQKENIRNNLIPDLIKLYTEDLDKINFKIYEGQRGIKSFYEYNLNEILKKGDTSYLLGAPKIGNEQIEGYLLDWHKRRQKKVVKLKAIYDADNREYGKVRAKMKHSQVRYFAAPISSPMWIEISKDVVGIGHFKENNVLLFSIKDKKIAKGYLDYFNLLWKGAIR